MINKISHSIYKGGKSSKTFVIQDQVHSIKKAITEINKLSGVAENPSYEGLAEKINYSKIKILIVDDEEINRLLLQKILIHYGFIEKNLIVLDNGKTAVDAVKNDNFDIILMDRKMPLMSGDEASEKIKEFNPNIPIIAVTGTPEGIENTKFDNCLNKPYGANELLNILQKTLLKKALN